MVLFWSKSKMMEADELITFLAYIYFIFRSIHLITYSLIYPLFIYSFIHSKSTHLIIYYSLYIPLEVSPSNKKKENRKEKKISPDLAINSRRF